MSTFESTAEAHRVARERASVAAALEASTLHTAIYDAREAGMSVREASRRLGCVEVDCLPSLARGTSLHCAGSRVGLRDSLARGARGYLGT